MILIELVEARRSLLNRCKELFTDEKIAEQIFRYLCEGLEECENKKDTFFQGWAWNNSNTTAYNQLPVNENRSLCKLRHRNGNCLCVGGFCTAVNDEICKSIRMSYEKGYVDGKTDAVRSENGQGERK